ncbi:MAG: OmpA family protein [Bacteroidales bacterium]|nr:OmpA family protein [Bacteroidales bacterium]
MKKIVLLVSVLAFTCAPLPAQNFLERLKERAKNAAENNIGNKVEKGVNDILNGEIGKKKNKDKNKQQEQVEEETSTTDATTWTCETCGHEGNTGKFCEECGAKNPAVAGSAAVAPKKQVTTAYAKSDFVPGDEIFFEDPVEGEQLGEFPSHWDSMSGNCEVAVINGEQVITMTDADTRITPLMKENPRNYLGDIYTFELDFWGTEFSENDEIDAARYQVLFGSEESDMQQSIGIQLYSHDGDYDIRANNASTGDEITKFGEIIPGLQRNAWNHLAVSFNQRAWKVYLNGERVFSAPNVKPATWVWITNNIWEARGYIKNVRIAKGAVPLYDRLASEGKIVTYAITFDTGKATLKPESTVEINRITELMKKDASLKFEVQGHCDSTGSDAVNDPLSQKRAEAIVAALVQNGIAAERLTAVGKGSHSPIADNSTDEGRAKNRRVEFVKK